MFLFDDYFDFVLGNVGWIDTLNHRCPCHYLYKYFQNIYSPKTYQKEYIKADNFIFGGCDVV